MARAERNAPILLLGTALLASGALLLALGDGLTFFQDTWSFLMYRREWDAAAFLDPHNEHIVLLPVAIQKLLLTWFGMSSAAPERVVLTALLLATALLFFVYARRRAGAWPALLLTVPLLFLGPAWQVLLWPFEMGYVGALLFGLAMLLALDRDERRDDALACLFLAIAIGFSSLGVAFAAGAAVHIWQRRRERGLRRAYLVAVPLLLYLAWYAGWGHTAESHVTLHNVLTSPVFVFDGLAGSLAALLGVSTVPIEGPGGPTWGRVLLPVAIAALAVVLVRRRGGRSSFRPDSETNDERAAWRLVSPGVWPVAATGAAFWLLAAFNYIPGREAYASRYMYAGAVFLLLLLAELLRGVRIGRPALLAAAAVVLAASLANLAILRDGERWLREETELARADLAAVEIARRTVERDFRLFPEVAGTYSLIDIQAGDYLEAVGEHGSPAYTEAELLDAPTEARGQADVLLARALPLSLGLDIEAGGTRAGCTTVPPGGGRAPIPLRPGATRIEVPPGEDAELDLRRYATEELPVSTEDLPAGTVSLLHIPADESSRPWRLRVEAGQRVRVCAAASSLR